MSRIQLLFRSAVLVLVATASSGLIMSCSTEADEPKPDKSIVELAQGTPDLSILVTALTKYPDLVTTLSGDGNFTVFAPTNAAFTALLTAIGQTSLDDIPADVLKNVLQYHVITAGAFKAAQLSNGTVSAANSESIQISISGGVKINNSVNVAIADIVGTNGVVHVVDAVMVPPSIVPIVGTIVAPAFFNKNFSTLVAAVKAADPAILTTLLGAGPSKKKMTLFAPTNDAFAAAGITSLPTDKALLTDVLKYHVIDDEVLAAELPAGRATIPTLGGNFYLSNNGSKGVYINATTKVIKTDITASNGVVHVIDRTLLPPSKTLAQIATDLAFSAAPQFTQLLAAVARTNGASTDILAASSNPTADLTVFAPTDAAFQNLYKVLGVNGVNDIPLETLIAVLAHHVVAARVFSTDLTNGVVATLNGNITINATDGTITDGKGNVAKLSSTPALLNVLGKNGVIHTIDKVLLP